MKTQTQCREEYEAAKRAFLAAIYNVNNETPFSEVEPTWWFEMMRVAEELRK